jgi:hypothetical protein
VPEVGVKSSVDQSSFAADRLVETTTSVKGETIDALYAGTHHDFGANIEAIMRPDGLPIAVTPATGGR